MNSSIKSAFSRSKLLALIKIIKDLLSCSYDGSVFGIDGEEYDEEREDRTKESEVKKFIINSLIII